LSAKPFFGHVHWTCALDLNTLADSGLIESKRALAILREARIPPGYIGLLDIDPPQLLVCRQRAHYSRVGAAHLALQSNAESWSLTWKASG
jgi:hypothetical protein